MIRIICSSFLLGLFLMGLLAPVGGQEILFEDRFEGSIKSGWAWRRGNAANCRFGNQGLEIRYEPHPEHEVPNVLFRRADFLGKGTVRIEAMVSHSAAPIEQYQQCGLSWLQDGRIVFKLVHERIDDQMYVFPGKIPVGTEPVALRITINGSDVIAECSSPGESSYRRIYEGKLAATTNDEVALFCSNGPKNEEHWARFRFFRIIRIEE